MSGKRSRRGVSGVAGMFDRLEGIARGADNLIRGRPSGRKSAEHFVNMALAVYDDGFGSDAALAWLDQALEMTAIEDRRRALWDEWRREGKLDEAVAAAMAADAGTGSGALEGAAAEEDRAFEDACEAVKGEVLAEWADRTGHPLIGEAGALFASDPDRYERRLQAGRRQLGWDVLDEVARERVQAILDDEAAGS
jgi:hypothetical protein